MMITENRLKYSNCFMILVCVHGLAFFMLTFIGAAGSIDSVNWNH